MTKIESLRTALEADDYARMAGIIRPSGFGKGTPMLAANWPSGLNPANWYSSREMAPGNSGDAGTQHRPRNRQMQERGELASQCPP